MRDLVIVIDHVEDDTTQEGKPFKRVIDKQGDKHRISQQLEDKWYMLKPDETIRLTMDTFNKGGKSFEYVKDIEKVTSIFEREAAAKVAQSKTPKDISIEAQVAVKAITDRIVADKPVPSETQELYDKWIHSTLEEALK